MPRSVYLVVKVRAGSRLQGMNLLDVGGSFVLFNFDVGHPERLRHVLAVRPSVERSLWIGIAGAAS